MTIIQTFVFFMVLWWMVFYITLPFGVKDDTDKVLGQASSAPKNPHIKLKMVIATVITAISTVAFRYYIS